MSRTNSPLRYPGGKSCLYDLMVELIALNKFERYEYAEPFAGGCGLALSLLYGGHVSDIHINDIDPSIWAFWHSVLNNNDELIELVENTEVTVEQWHIQRDVNREQDLKDPLSLGFSAFFLNRTNRSGIIKGAGVIGGLEQKGNYKIDCRFNASELASRIRRIAKYKDRIHLTRIDGAKYLASSEKRLGLNTLLCIDPPYFHKGPGLYTSSYNTSDHSQLAKVIADVENPWVVTYDDCPEILELYKKFRVLPFDLNYSLQTKRVGSEVFVASKGLRLPKRLRDGLSVL